MRKPGGGTSTANELDELNGINWDNSNSNVHRVSSATGFESAFQGNPDSDGRILIILDNDIQIGENTATDQWIKVAGVNDTPVARAYINLNGHTITTYKKLCSKANSSVTFYNGTVNSTGDNARDHVFEAHGDNSNLILENVTVTSRERVVHGQNSGNIIINNCTFTHEGESSDIDYGGAIYVDSGKNLTLNNTTITGFKASSSTTGACGGAISLNNSTLTIDNDPEHTINNNSAKTDGGAIYAVNGSTVNLNNGTITGNQAQGGSGGAIFATNSTVNVNGGTLSNNTAKDNGGAIYFYVDPNGTKRTLTLNGGTFDNNSSLLGGGIFANGNTTVDVKGGSISNNTANDRGGGICSYGNSVINVESGTISGNTGGTKDRSTGENPANGGGGIYIDGHTHLNVTGGDITSNNSYEGGGGGIRAGYYDYAQDMRIKITGGNISGNYSKGEGGGISIGASAHATIAGTDPNNPLKIDSNNVDENTSTWGGGGVFVADGGTLLVQNALVTGNKADGFGGGIAGCSTGRIIIGKSIDENDGTPGAAIFDNDAKGDLVNGLSGDKSAKHDDHIIARGNTVFLNNGYDDYFCALNSTVYEKMLGGGSENYSGSYDSVKIEQNDNLDQYDATSIMGLTAHPTDGDKERANGKRTVEISGNYSGTHGGGILCNGIMVMGTVDNATFNDRLIVAGLKGITDGTNELSYSDVNKDFSFEVLDKDFNRVATKNTYQFPDDHDLVKTAANNQKFNKGIMYITIPYKNDTQYRNGEIPSRTYYIHELPSGVDYKIDDTVYKIVVDGKQSSARQGISADFNDDQANPKDVLKITENQISNVTVTTGKFTFAKDGQVNGFTDKVEDNQNIAQTPYAKKLDCGVQYAKYLWIGIEGKTVSHDDNNGKINEDRFSVNNINDERDTNNNVKGPDIHDRTAFGGGAGTENFDNTTDFVGGKDSKYGLRDFDNNEDVHNSEKVKWEITLNNAFTNTKVKAYSVEKVWNDANNADGKRPEYVRVMLYKNSNNQPYDGKIVKLDSDNNWSYTWDNLPYGSDYTVKELNGNQPVEEGKVSVDGEDGKDGYTVSYTDVKNIEVNAYNKPEIPAEGVTYRLINTADNSVARDVSGNPVADITLNEKNKWTDTFRNLPKNLNYEIVRVTSVPDDYKNNRDAYAELTNVSPFEFDGRVVTNTHNQETTSVGVTKKWMTTESPEGKQVTLDLFADGVKQNDKSITLDGAVDANEDQPWHALWSNLPKNRFTDGKSTEIKYTVQEATALPGYKVTYHDENGKKLKDNYAKNGQYIYNTHLIDFTVTKKWNDNDNSAGKRPDRIKVRLNRGEKGKYNEVELSESNNWTYTWKDLPEVDDHGNVNTYTAEETDLNRYYIPSYDITGNNVVITNTYTEDKPNAENKLSNEVRLTIHKTFRGDQIPDQNQKNLKFRVTGTGKKTDDNGTVTDVKVDETVSYASFLNGSYTFYHLYPGEYTVTETNSGVKGYKVSVKYVVDGKTSQKVNAVEAGKEYKIDITDEYHKDAEKKNSVDTSDHTNIPWSAGILGISMLIGISALILRKRYN